jgi:hypothetical protein
MREGGRQRRVGGEGARIDPEEDDCRGRYGWPPACAVRGEEVRGWSRSTRRPSGSPPAGGWAACGGTEREEERERSRRAAVAKGKEGAGWGGGELGLRLGLK